MSGRGKAPGPRTGYEILELLAALEDGEHFNTIAAVLAGFEGRT